MANDNSPRVLQIRMTQAEYAVVAQRGATTSEAGRNIIGRYLALLSTGRALARAALTPAEIAACVSLLNGTYIDETSCTRLWMEVDDVDGEFDGLDVEAKSLSAKLRDLGPMVSAAICDAAERFWNGVSFGIQADPANALEEPQGLPPTIIVTEKDE